MASVKLAYMPQQENNRVFAQYSPVDPPSRTSSAVGSGIWSSAPPATPQSSSSSSYIGTAWASPLAVPPPSAATTYTTTPPAAGGPAGAYQAAPKLLADLTVGSEPVPDRTSPGPSAISGYPSTQSLSSAGSRLSSRHNSQTEAKSPLVPSPTAAPSTLVPTPAASAPIGGSSSGGPSDEIINTAIVVKNIPFAIKKEQLIDFMTQLGLPLPYAFNYHFDNGVFRGLAFANFTTADETAAVISILNGRELGGRRLRVEYKKMLPFQERERIEREKRERRGQLEEQHQQGSGGNAAAGGAPAAPTAATSVPVTPPHGAVHSHGAAHAGHAASVSAAQAVTAPTMPKADMNDAETLQMYSSLLVFKHDLSRAELVIPHGAASGMNAKQTYMLTLLCRQLELHSVQTEEQDIIISRTMGADAQSKSDSTLDTPSYLSGVLGGAIATAAVPSLARVNPSAIGATQNITALSALNRWNSVGNLPGIVGGSSVGVGGSSVGAGVGMIPQAWVPAPGNAPAPQVGGSSDASGRKYYETVFQHGAPNGVDRRH